MFKILKNLFSAAPLVDYVDFEDGLLAVRSKRALRPENTTVKVRKKGVTLKTLVLLESYDHERELYRLKPLETEILLEALNLERRVKARYDKSVRVTSPHFPGFTGMTEDISVEGCRVTTQGPLELARDIVVKLELDDTEIPPLQVLADVAWTSQRFDEGFHSGLRFQTLSPQSSRVIQTYINDRLAIGKKLHTLENDQDWVLK